MTQISTPVKLTTVKHFTTVDNFSSGFVSEWIVDLHGTVNWLQCPQVRTPSDIDNLQLTPLKPFSLLLRMGGTTPIAGDPQCLQETGVP